MSRRRGLPGLPTKAPHVEIVDLDSDGWPDILATASASAGAPPSSGTSGSTGPGCHVRRPPGLGEQYWVEASIVDFDHDGRLDVFVAEFEPDLRAALFRGAGTVGHWIAVDGSALPLGGVGATVEVRDPAGGAILGAAELSATTGYAAGAPPIAYVGTGSAGVVDVIIRSSAFALEFRGVPVHRLIRPPVC